MNSSKSNIPSDAHPDGPGASDAMSSDALMHPVSRRRAAIWNTIFSYIGIILVLARNIALVPIFLKYIGKDEYNAWLISGAVLMQLTNIDFGLMGVLMQQVAAAYGARDRRRLEQLIGTGVILAVVISLLMGGITAGISPFLPKIIDVSPDVGHRLTICFLMVSLANAVQLFGFATGGILKSLQRTFLAGLFMALSELVSLCSTLYLIFAGWGLYAIGMGLLIRALVEAVGTTGSFCWIGLWRLKIRPQFQWLQVRRLWRLSSYQFFTQIAGRIKTSIDSFLIGVVVGKDAGGTYALTTRAHDTVRMFAQGFSGAFPPALAHIHGEGNLPKFKEMILLLFKLQALAAAIGFGGVIAFNRTFMNLWVGPGIYSGAAVNVLVALAAIVYHWSVAPYEAVFTRGGFAPIAKIVWAEVTLRMLVMVALLRMLGVVGAPLASLLCQTVGILLPLTWITANGLHFTKAELGSLLGWMLKLLVGPMILAAAFAVELKPAGTWSVLIFQACIYLVLCLIVTWLLDAKIVRFVLRRGRGAIT